MDGERWYALYVVKKSINFVTLKISMILEDLRVYILPIARSVEKS